MSVYEVLVLAKRSRWKVDLPVASGEPVLLRRLMGVFDAVPGDWPEKPPPPIDDVRTFSSVALDPVRVLRHVQSR